jgi:uncharacterized protein YegL
MIGFYRFCGFFRFLGFLGLFWLSGFFQFGPAALARASGRDQAVFRSQVDTVLLDVLATDRRGVVPNLRAADFEVRDNGVIQTLTHVSGEVAPLGVFLLLDTSGSLSPRELDHLRQGATAVASTLRTGDELRLITFSHYVTLHGLIDSDALARIFGRLEPLGETALHDALTAGFRLSERQDTKRPVVIAFSDGADTASWMTEKNVDDAARQSWAAFFAATPRAAAVPIFGDLASLTGGVTLTLDADFANLHAIVERTRLARARGAREEIECEGGRETRILAALGQLATCN